MKLRALLLCTVLVSPALAQPQDKPERLEPADMISIAVGHSQSFRFKVPFDSVAVAAQGIVQASAQSDHVLSLYGQAEGVTVLSVRSKGQEVYVATVQITTEPGHTVRIYGTTSKDKTVPDYTGFFCTEVFCGRADKELAGSRDPSSRSVTVTDTPVGRSVTTTNTYGSGR
jgi:hypothetical protein